MKLQEAIDMILKELDTVQHPGKTKEEIILWRYGFVIGMLADELRSDYILEQNLKNRIRYVRENPGKRPKNQLKR
jgi:hypothetical protein